MQINCNIISIKLIPPTIRLNQTLFLLIRNSQQKLNDERMAITLTCDKRKNVYADSTSQGNFENDHPGNLTFWPLFVGL